MINVSVKITGGAKTMARMADLEKRIPGAVKMAVRTQAQELRKVIVRGVRDQNPGGKTFKPLADSTKLMKRSSKALIDKGDMVRSVNVTSEVGDVIFVGVHRNARAKDGGELMSIAEFHEFGTKPYRIPVTTKLRAFWRAMFIKGIFGAPLSAKTTEINHPGVPERPWLRPAYQEWQTDASRRFKEILRQRLGVGRR